VLFEEVVVVILFRLDKEVLKTEFFGLFLLFSLKYSNTES
jgi:hypothetical protein